MKCTFYMNANYKHANLSMNVLGEKEVRASLGFNTAIEAQESPCLLTQLNVTCQT